MTPAQIAAAKAARPRKSARTQGMNPTQPTLVTHAAIYARVSTRDKGQDAENQLLAMREFCQREGWGYQEFVDQDHGDSSGREAFARLMEAVGQRRVRVVMFWSLDRFSREGALATLTHLDTLNRAGVDWVSYTEQYLRSTTLGPFKDAVIAILATIARQELVRIRERVRAGMARAKANGAKIGRPVVGIDEEGLRRMMAAKWSVGQIARAMGKSRTTIHRKMVELMEPQAQAADGEK